MLSGFLLPPQAETTTARHSVVSTGVTQRSRFVVEAARKLVRFMEFVVEVMVS